MELSWLMFWRKREDFDFISDDGKVECFKCGRLCVPGKYRRDGATICAWCAGKAKIFPIPPECFDCVDEKLAIKLTKKRGKLGFVDRTLCASWDKAKNRCSRGFPCSY